MATPLFYVSAVIIRLIVLFTERFLVNEVISNRFITCAFCLRLCHEKKEKAKMSEYAIEMLGITKRFPGIIANDNITLQLKKGEIHALLGEKWSR